MAERRRTTLGNVSGMALNARAGALQAAGAGAAQQRASLAATKRPSITATKAGRFSIMSSSSAQAANTSFAHGSTAGGGSRLSTAAQSGRKSSNGVRRSSTYASSGGSKQDPRPVSDKAYVNASIRALVEYLSDHGYDQPISAKILTRPSGRDFNNIMAFLFRQIDPQWQPSTARLEEEIIPMLKAIRYPFTVSKASLQAVGAPQTWPKMLAVVSWLVELLAYDEEVQAHEQQQQERRAAAGVGGVGGRGGVGIGAELDGMADQALDDKAFFDYLGQAYRCFLDGDDDTYAALEQELIGGYETHNAQAAAEAEELAAANEELRRQIADVKGRADLLPGLVQRKADLMSDLGKFEHLVAQLRAHKQALEAKTEVRAAEEVRLKAEAAELSSRVATLRERIAGQELSAEDVARMAREQQRLRDGIAAAAEHRVAAQGRVWAGETALTERLDALDAAVYAYGAKAAALKLVPATAQNANGVNYDLAVRRRPAVGTAAAGGCDEAGPLLNNDVRGVLRPALAVLKAAVAARVQEVGQEELDLLDVLDASHEEVADLRAETQMMETRVRRAEDQFRKDKEAADAAAAAAAAEAAALEARLAALHDAEEVGRQTARQMAAAAQLRVALETQRERAQQAREELHGAILDALNLCTDHKEAVQQRLAELREVAEQVRSAVVGADDLAAAALAEPLAEPLDDSGCGACEISAAVAPAATPPAAASVASAPAENGGDAVPLPAVAEAGAKGGEVGATEAGPVGGVDELAAASKAVQL